MNRLDAAFARLQARGELGLFPYLTTGFPDPAGCAELLEVVAANGADGIELGVPFSDPLADGATLQRAGALALEQGASIDMAFELLRGFRSRWEIPAILMTYFNPILAYGPERFAREGRAAGMDGVIVPDLPLEEAEPLLSACRGEGLHLVLLAAPTSTDDRLARAGQLAGGFLYCVALVGTTGARHQLAPELPEFLRRVRSFCTQPLVVGFGISRPEHVAAMRGKAEGVIVASGLSDLIATTLPEQRTEVVAAYTRALKTATTPALAPSASGQP
jgi:tryptophan synthase alpha chain